MKKRTWIIIFCAILLLIIIGVVFSVLSKRENKDVNKDFSSNTIDKKLSVHYINVGQGDSELVVMPDGKTILIDCGDNDAGQKVVDYIKSLKIISIDALIATHPDADHIGGCDDVMKNFEVLSVYDDGLSKDTKTFRDYNNFAEQTNHYFVKQDFSLPLDEEVYLQVFVAYDSAGVFDDVNEDSIVLKIVYKNASFLFDADCEADCEKAITDTADLDVDVLKVGHHGSRTSSTDHFLSEVTPKISIISVAASNRYGHPHQETLDKLSNTELYTTEEKGDIIITTNGNGYSVETSK